MSEVTEDLALHVVFQGGEPAAGLLVHGVMQLQKLHQLLSLHLIAQILFEGSAPLSSTKSKKNMCRSIRHKRQLSSYPFVLQVLDLGGVVAVSLAMAEDLES